MVLKRINGEIDESGASVVISEANFPAPFSASLEYAAPARGTWNIVHVGMLVPEAHEIFVCPQGCLRGVVLTAAEMGASNRFSTITVRENNLNDGDMENLIIDGVADVLAKLPYSPRAVLVYTSCVHHFVGCDLPMVYRKLRENHPDVDFVDCYMTPIMRKSGLTPDQLMRRQLYSLLKEREKDEKSINIIGNNFSLDKESEAVKLITDNGWKLREITECKTYDEYQEMASSSANITLIPSAIAAGNELEKRFGQKHLYLPLSYNYGEIIKGLNTLAEYMGVSLPDYSEKIAQCDDALAKAKSVIKDAPIAIDYTISSRPLSLARLLYEHGFNVERVYADAFTAEEKEDFLKLREICPNLKIYATVHMKMRCLPRVNEEKILAIGQKAAYFTGSDYFVNVVEGGGMYGFEGIIRMAELMSEAFLQPKDTRSLIQIKGMGCSCCH